MEEGQRRAGHNGQHEGTWAPGDQPVSWDVKIPTDDTSVTRRRRALAPVLALGDLDRNKASYAGGFWDQYDLASIALAVIDQVALAMGISAGRSWDEAVDYAASEAARQCPTDPDEVHREVAERVIVSLVTTDVVAVPYLAHGPDGPGWRSHRFRLLYAHPSGPDGTEHLRASEQAINVFVTALDLDVEAAQIANEAQMRALIERGAVGSATELAQIARYQSAQYLEKTRRIVADTALDPGGHDWAVEVPALLDAALTHVQERLAAEGELVAALTAQRAEVDDADTLVHVNELISRLRDCRQRHNELHGHLIEARGRHREALERRLERPPSATHRADIGADLLGPYLELPTDAAARAAEAIVARSGGTSHRWWPTLAVLTDELCAPPREAPEGVEYLEPVFDDTDQLDWWEPYEDLVDAVLGEVTESAPLSVLLERAEAVAAAIDVDGEALDGHLARCAVVHAAHRAWATQVSGGGAGDLLVAVTGPERIERDGISCNDLIVVRAQRVPDGHASTEPAAVAS